MSLNYSTYRILLVLMLLMIPTTASAESSSSVISNFMCPCGSCDEPLITCECPESDQYRIQIVDMMRDGYTRDQIVQDFVGRFGTSVLADKTPSSGSWMFEVDRRKIGFLLVGVSLLVVVFMSGRYFGFHSCGRAIVNKSRGAKKESRKKRETVSDSKHKTKDFYDEMLDDYKYD